MSDPVKYVFLVAGNEYHYHLGFLQCCTGRVYQLIRQIDDTKEANPYGLTFPTKVVFLRFDVGTGKVSTFEKTITDHRTRPFSVAWTLLSRHDTARNRYTTSFKELLGVDVSLGPFRKLVLKDDYEPNPNSDSSNLKLSTPDDSIKEIMSASSIYTAVRSAPAGSVLELSIFSHSLADGPILVNTFNVRTPGLAPNVRSPRDVDCRARYDFNRSMGEDTTEDRLTPFIKAFQTGTDPGGKTRIVGEIHIWGCMQSSPINESIKRLMVDGTTLTDATDCEILKVRKDDKGKPIKKKNGGLQFDVVGKIKFSEFKKRMARLVRLAVSDTGAITLRYVYYCARKTGIPTWGAAVGDSTNTKNTKVMKTESDHVSAFFEKHMGFTVDDEGYGKIDAEQVQKIDALAGTPFPSVP
jgi:hypothetical protein